MWQAGKRRRFSYSILIYNTLGMCTRDCQEITSLDTYICLPACLRQRSVFVLRLECTYSKSVLAPRYSYNTRSQEQATDGPSNWHRVEKRR